MVFRKKLYAFIPVLVLSSIIFIAISSNEVYSQTDTGAYTLICGSEKCGPEDVCSSVVPCKRRIDVSCVDVDGDGVVECNYKLITDDTCNRLCDPGECEDGECVKKTGCDYGDVKYGQECVTTDCYTGTRRITCRSDGTWDTGECEPSDPFDYRCDSKQECVDGECVSVDEKEDEPGGFLGILFLIMLILALLGIGVYIAYHYLRKSKPKETIKPSFTPTYVPRRPAQRKPLEKAKVREIVKKRREEVEKKRKEFLEAFTGKSKKTIPKKTKE